jgi:hypothetical protein
METKDFEAYGNRAARLKFYSPEYGHSIDMSEKEHLAKLAISQERIEKKRRRTMADRIVDQMFTIPFDERLEYLMSLPVDYPFQHIDRRLLPKLFVVMRDRWFCPNKEKRKQQRIANSTLVSDENEK